MRNFVRAAYVWLLQTKRTLGLLRSTPSYIQNWRAYLVREFFWPWGLFTVKLKDGLVLTLRSGTYDKFILDEIFYSKGYQEGILSLENRESPIVIDLGAHVGIFTLFILSKFPNAKVVAVEAVPENGRLTQINISQNNLDDKVRLVNEAVTKERGELTMYLRGRRTAQHSAHQKSDTSVTVPATTLGEIWQRFSFTHCDLLKLDIEGSEFDVITSTPPHILSRIRCITMEHHPFAGYNLDDLVEYLSKSGFTVEVSKESNHLVAYHS